MVGITVVRWVGVTIVYGAQRLDCVAQADDTRHPVRRIACAAVCGTHGWGMCAIRSEAWLVSCHRGDWGLPAMALSVPQSSSAYAEPAR